MSTSFFTNKKIIFLMLFFLLMPYSGFCISLKDLKDSPSVGPGTRVYGKCRSGPIATPSDVSTASTWVADKIGAQIKKVGENLAMESQKSTSIITKLFEDQNTKFNNMLKQFRMAQQRSKTTEEFGPQAMFNSICDSPELAAGLQVGKNAAVKIKKTLQTEVSKYNSKWKSFKDIEKYNTSKKYEDMDSSVLFPDQRTLTTKNLKRAKDLVEISTNPYPELVLTDRQKKTRKGKEYENLKKIKKARISLSQEVYNAHIAVNSPTMSLGRWYKNSYKKITGSNETPDAIVNGKVSPNAVLEMATDLRFANPNWYSDLAKKNYMAMERELLSMTAVRMEIEYRQLMLLQQIALLLAQDQAVKTNQLNGQLEELKQDAFKETKM